MVLSDLSWVSPPNSLSWMPPRLAASSATAANWVDAARAAMRRSGSEGEAGASAAEITTDILAMVAAGSSGTGAVSIGTEPLTA